MKKLLTYKRIYLLLLMPISLILILLAKKSSFFSEQIYAKHIYRIFSRIISLITGLFPFSVAELIVIALPIALLIIVVRFLLLLILDKKERRDRWIKGLLNLFCTLSILLFLFTILGGLNYYRYPFITYSNLEITDSSVEELYALTDSLMQEANTLRAEVIMTDSQGVFQLSMSDTELAKEANQAYRQLAKAYPVLSGAYAAPKPILLSKLMSQTEITGIFFPFTMEANVNVDVPDYSIPATMLHELAHLRGFMREDEANYIAYLAGMSSDDVELQYSSTMLALIIAGNALYDASPNLYFNIREQYSEGVISDIRANSVYWQQFEDTVVSTVSNKLNDTYLKANAQTDGVQSYGRMLDLLLAKYRKDQELKK
ncbi:MAG: hypothetical protein H6Q59_1154 [Firmicutes bacterium]|nr:hypothetical protein [Bacillota bacterium]